MNELCQLTPVNLSDATALDTLVEHRRIFNLKHCELNIFETFHRCDNVSLSYNGLVVSSMMRGKKVMSLQHDKQFDFLPGESVILPEGITMKVDFPEADIKHPVQCATLALDWEMVNRNITFLNEHYPNNTFPFEWKLNFSNYHFLNNKELAASLNSLISISMEDNTAKDALADLALKFLLLRVVQTQNLVLMGNNDSGNHRLSPLIAYIKTHLSEKLTIALLAREACMSKSALFQAFKAQFGIPPLEFVLRERVEFAKRLMAIPGMTVKDACHQSGFNNLNYFSRIFKRVEGITPGVYRN